MHIGVHHDDVRACFDDIELVRRSFTNLWHIRRTLAYVYAVSTVCCAPPRSGAHRIEVIVDAVDEDGGATARSQADAPEIDGEVFLRDAGHLAAGDIARVLVEDADEHDLYGVPI